MDRVRKGSQTTFDEVQHVAIAIRLIDTHGRHIGVLHRDSDSKELLLLHLAWQKDLRNRAPSDGYLWVDPAIPKRRLIQVAALCRRVWRANRNGGIPYGFSPPNDCFDQHIGKFLLGPTRFGLTCATFVLAVFHLAGLQLIDYATWPTGRDGDVEWQQFILSQLCKTPSATPQHIANVESEIGAVRYRPEEVAGAATISALPAAFSIAHERGRQILNRLQDT